VQPSQLPRRGNRRPQRNRKNRRSRAPLLGSSYTRPRLANTWISRQQPELLAAKMTRRAPQRAPALNIRSVLPWEARRRKQKHHPGEAAPIRQRALKTPSPPHPRRRGSNRRRLLHCVLAGGPQASLAQEPRGRVHPAGEVGSSAQLSSGPAQRQSRWVVVSRRSFTASTNSRGVSEPPLASRLFSADLGRRATRDCSSGGGTRAMRARSAGWQGAARQELAGAWGFGVAERWHAPGHN
jgi:hypothetical protein